MRKLKNITKAPEENRFDTDLCQYQLKELGSITNKKGFLQKSVFRTLEGYNYRNILALKLYIEDIIVDLRACKDESRLGKWVEQLNIIYSILNVREDRYYFLHQGKFYRWCDYGYTTEDNSGRLYSFGASPQRLKRTVRFLLFENHYTDVDISNAHPSFLLEFSKSVGLSTPVLEEFVSRRDKFQEQVAKELNCHFKECKVAILKLINQTRDEASKVLKESETLSSLFKEVLVIRKAIWEKHPAESRLADLVSRNTPPEKQIVSNTAYYLQNRETYYLLLLKEWLEKDFFKDTPFQGKLTATEAGLLLFIPMFDGALVRYYMDTEHDNIKTKVAAFNELNPVVKFKVKPLEAEPDILDKEGLQRYLVLLDFLSVVGPTTSLLIMKHFNVNTDIVDDQLLCHVKSTSLGMKEKIQARELEIKRLKKIRAKGASKKMTDVLNRKLEILYKAQRNDSYYRMSKHEKALLSNRIQERMSKVRKELLKYCDSSESLGLYVSQILQQKAGESKDEEDISLEPFDT
jgi:hypothetical protein